MQIEKIITTIIICITIGVITWFGMDKYQDMIWATSKANQIQAVHECMQTSKMETKLDLGTTQEFNNDLYKQCMQDKGYPTSSK